jgi:integral membrane protein (TIGR00529 family)
MPGGALLSAPLVDAAGNRTGLPAKKLAAINYWFRHVLEYVWPLYPGIILSASILELEAGTIVSAQWPMSAGMILGGIVFLLIPLGKLAPEKGTDGFLKNLGAVMGSMWPILVAVVLSFAFSIDLYIAVAAALVLFVLVGRYKGKILLDAARRSVTFQYVSFVFAVMIFKQVFVDSQAADIVAAEITTAGIDPIWVVIFIPFIIGLISGATPAFVSLSYPALMPFIKPDGVDLPLMATAYCAGFFGTLVSPLHFCLVLTVDYFKTTLGQVYIYLIGPLALMVLGLVAKFLIQ